MPGSGPGWSATFRRERISMVRRITPLEDVTSDWAWGGSDGAGVKVAVIDSGVESGHPGVGEVQGYASVSWRGDEPVIDTEPHDDHFGHGTACAGIVRSLAPACEIYSVRVLGKLMTTRGEVFAAGLRWAIEQGMDVCNLSLTTPKRELFGPLHELADQAYFSNCILVTSANNLTTASYPAMYASVVSVASHDIPDPETLFYNPTPPVEFGAQGIDVRVPWKGGGWLTMTGNSFATPHVAGLVARMLAKHPGLTPFQVKSILRAVAANVGPSA